MSIAIVNGRHVRICTVPGCEREHTARGWCRQHYNRWRLGCRLIEFDSPIGPYGANGVPDEPQVIPVGLVPDDAGLPMPYSAALQARRAGLERRDAARDARDSAAGWWWSDSGWQHRTSTVNGHGDAAVSDSAVPPRDENDRFGHRHLTPSYPHVQRGENDRLRESA